MVKGDILLTLGDILLTLEDGVATIILSQPGKLNAITTEMADKFRGIIEKIRVDDAVKVLIITGAGRGFCAGADITRRVAAAEQIRRERWRIISRTGYQLLPLAKLEKPTIAAINGIAAGLGLSIALACDIRVASEHARFTAAWVNNGLMADGGATYFLPRILGISKALEMMFTADTIDAIEAERVGLVSKVVPHDDLMAVAKELASKMAKKPSVAIELMKKATYRSLNHDLESQLDFEAYAQNVCRQTDDYKEAIEAFTQKRPPQFKGY
jgi:2-(1,2-epoxy-1,2-dihydrophenyl)acetyl-CoA isomerase